MARETQSYDQEVQEKINSLTMIAHGTKVLREQGDRPYSVPGQRVDETRMKGVKYPLHVINRARDIDEMAHQDVMYNRKARVYKAQRATSRSRAKVRATQKRDGGLYK